MDGSKVACNDEFNIKLDICVATTTALLRLVTARLALIATRKQPLATLFPNSHHWLAALSNDELVIVCTELNSIDSRQCRQQLYSDLISVPSVWPTYSATFSLTRRELPSATFLRMLTRLKRNRFAASRLSNAYPAQGNKLTSSLPLN